MVQGRPQRLVREASHGRLLDTLVHGVQENDVGGVIVYSNRAHHRILGYEFGELVGKRIWDLQPTPAERDSLERYFVALVRDQPEPAPFLSRSRRKDGALVDLQVDWNYVRDKEGALQGFISIITDITASRRLEESLRDRTRGLATLLEVSRNLASTLELRRVLRAAVDGAVEVAGLDTAAIYLLEGRHLQLWTTFPRLPEEFPEELRLAPLVEHPHLDRAISTGAPVLLEDARGASLTPGERLAVEQRDLRTLLYLPLVAGETAVGALIVGSVGNPVALSEEAVDLCRTLANLSALAVRNSQLYLERERYCTELERSIAERQRGERERERLQTQLAQSRKLESIGQLAGGLAHDLNNMLGVVLGQAELTMKRVGPEDPVHAELREIHAAAGRSARLIQQLLAFARRQTIAPRVLDLNEYVEAMATMLRRLVREGIELEWLPDPGLWDVLLDPAQLDQVLVNLLVNARDSIAGSGAIRVETRNVSLGRDAAGERPWVVPGDYVALLVSDTGCGMDATTRARVFEPFFTTKEKGRGTGMGLATVYGIVKQNGGFVDVSSEPGMGAVFSVYLPRHERQEEPQRPELEAEPAATGAGTVLVVEDEPALLALAARMLEAQGFRVLAAASPAEALRIAREEPGEIRLLVTDVIMPQMNGPELASRLVELKPGLRRLFTSGYTANVIAHHGVLDEGVHFLQKPFSMANLAAKVREALE